MEKLEQRTLLASAAFDQVDDHAHESLVDVYTPPASFVYSPGGFLSGPARGKPLDVALNFLRQNAGGFGLAAEDLESPIVESIYTDTLSGVTHVYLVQEYNGLAVTNARMNVSVMPDGSILAAGGGFVPGLSAAERNAPAPAPQLDPRQALVAIADDLEVARQDPITITNRTSRLDKRQTLVARDFSTTDITAHLQYVALPEGGVALGWKMVLDLPGGEHWYELTVDSARGTILHAADYVAHLGTYNVIAAPQAHPHDPSSATAPNRTVVTDPADTLASPFGWHDNNGADGAEFTTTQGNNVHAYVDRDGSSNVPDPGSSPDGGPGLVFDFPIDLTQAPTTYQPAAVTNLFYWNNLIHDVTYRYGFTEAAGNFQTNNYGRGGAGNDYVQAEAQDGSGVNNANFATPSDGSRPRMQMYLWNQTTPGRDGDLDNRIIVHEYTHGISNRLTGGPNNSSALGSTQSRGMGEGWSDFLSLLFTQKATDMQNDKFGVGTYSKGQPNDGQGVRRFPYSYDKMINPLTFEAYGSGSVVYQTYSGPVTVTKSTQVHNSGELWNSALWDMTWNLIEKHGFSENFAAGYDPGSGNDKGNQLAMRLVLDGMKLQPSNPSFIQARDAILAADVALTGGANQIEIWRAFARRGLGFGAATSSASSTTVTVSFEIPIADPVVNAHTPVGSSLAPISFAEYTFNQPMDQSSFSVADDVVSFTGPNGIDVKPMITGYSWTANNKLRIDFGPTAARGSYSLVIGPNILAADDGMPMDSDTDQTPGEIPEDQYSISFSYNTFLGPEGFDYKAAQFPVEGVDLVIGQPGVNVLVNGTDDNASSFALPAGNTFNYYGTSQSTFFVNPNGLITFGSAVNSWSNSDLTTTPSQASIAVLWDDWRTDLTASGATDSAVLWKVDGDRLIIEWSDVTNRSSSDGAVTFQAILQLNTGAAPGRIILNYPDITTNNVTQSNGASSSTGIKNTGSQSGSNPLANRLLVSQNTNGNPWVQTGSAVLIATDVEGPIPTASAFNYLTSHTVTVTFSEDVSDLDAADLVLHNDTTNTTVSAAAQLVSYDQGTRTATFSFPGLAGQLLEDGEYTATLLASGVTDVNGNPMDGDDNGVFGGDYVFNFFHLSGDFNHDGQVNLNDFNILANNFGQSGRDFSQGDANYDGTVNLADFNLLANKFGTSLGGAGATASSGSLGGTTGSVKAAAGRSPFGGGGQIGTPRQDREELPEVL